MPPRAVRRAWHTHCDTAAEALALLLGRCSRHRLAHGEHADGEGGVREARLTRGTKGGKGEGMPRGTKGGQGEGMPHGTKGGKGEGMPCGTKGGIKGGFWGVPARVWFFGIVKLTNPPWRGDRGPSPTLASGPRFEASKQEGARRCENVAIQPTSVSFVSGGGMHAGTGSMREWESCGTR